VSDFLGRLAARALGEAPVARPRQPALFEAGKTAAEAWPDVVNEEVVVPSGGSQDRAGPARPAPRLPLPPELPASARPPGGGSREASAAAATASRREHWQEASPASPSPRIPQEPVIARAGGRSSRDGGDATSEPSAAAPPTSPEAVLTQRAAPVVAAPAALVGTASGTASAQLPPVRVHIGRLEVRANVQEPPRPQPLREEPREPGLLLSDYLRGRREAR
jgi:hypothetical protein